MGMILKAPVALPLGPPVRSTLERALERIQELEAEIISLQAQRQVLMDSERALVQRLSSLDTLAREITERVEKMTSAIDK